MKYLLYGILPADFVPPDRLPLGLEGQPVVLLAGPGVAAAVSAVNETIAAAPDLSRLLAYARVIEALARMTTILPLRYGCLLDSPGQVRELLDRRAGSYQKLLREVAGCVEMSLRVLLPDSGEPLATPAAALPSDYPTGRSYLAARKEAFARKDATQATAARLTERVLAGLENCYVRFLGDSPGNRSPRLLTLYFLVPVADLDRFREAVRQLQPRVAERLLLTGPWPPYNFVTDPTQEGWP